MLRYVFLRTSTYVGKLVRQNLLQQMKTAATSDRFEELEPIPTTPHTYTHDSDDNVEEFATANWREEEIYAPSRKHLICSIAGRSDTMSCSLG